MRLSKIISSALSLALGLSLVVPASATESGFTDVAANAYYANAVSWAVEKGITSGTSATTFSPDETCTKAQILTFLWRAHGSTKSSFANPFSDVSGSDYYYDAAIWAYEKGLEGRTQFNGDTPCTRSSTVTYLWLLAGRPSVGSSNFTDVSPNADYVSTVLWAVSKNITAGTSDTTFSPDLTCTRGQIVTFLYRAETPETQQTLKSSIDRLIAGEKIIPPNLVGKFYNQMTEEEKAQLATLIDPAALNIMKNVSNMSVDEYGGLVQYVPGLQHS